MPAQGYHKPYREPPLTPGGLALLHRIGPCSIQGAAMPTSMRIDLAAKTGRRASALLIGAAGIAMAAVPEAPSVSTPVRVTSTTPYVPPPADSTSVPDVTACMGPA